MLPRLLGWDGDRVIPLQNYILLIFSIVFYAFGGLKYLLLIAAVIAINWAGGFWVAGSKKRLGLVVACDIALLFFFKYFNLLIACIENIFFPESAGFAGVMTGILSGEGNGSLGLISIALPVGISFYTFQALSYVIDVYRGTVKPQRNLWYFALYISCFPQLIAGPIVQYQDIETQLTDRTCSSDQFAEGISRFCYGLAKKVLLANTLGAVADAIWATDVSTLDVTVAWVGSLAYTFQIYYDFSGYSDMAIGLGKMFGLEFKENFNYPYQATSVQDFWRRWHISLSSWFREYVYIPLGGNRHGKANTMKNVFIVFLLTGIWHGANWTFLVWGVVYGLILIVERLGLGTILKKCPVKFFNRILTFIIVNFLWVVFRADNIMNAGVYISRMFVGGFDPTQLFTYISGMSIVAFVLAVVLAGPIQRIMGGRLRLEKRVVLPLVLLVVSIIFLVNNTYNPFIYYQF